MSYAINYADLWRRAARYVDKTLQGMKPGDLPVEQPTRTALLAAGEAIVVVVRQPVYRLCRTAWVRLWHIASTRRSTLRDSCGRRGVLEWVDRGCVGNIAGCLRVHCPSSRLYTADVASVALREPLNLEVASACWGTTRPRRDIPFADMRGIPGMGLGVWSASRWPTVVNLSACEQV
jgi:hypothetical protein